MPPVHWPSRKTETEIAERTVEGIAVGAAIRVASYILAASAASAAVAVVATQSSNQMHVGAKAVVFIERHEGVRHYPYQDPSGVAACTVGAGHVLAWRYCTAAEMRTYYSQAKVDALLRGDVGHAERCVQQAAGAITQPAFEALVDLAFNAGCGSLYWHSRPYYRTLASLARAGELELLAAEVRNTATTAGGRYLAGLATRRRDEATLMLTGYYGPGIGYYVRPKPRPAGYWCHRYRYAWSTCV
jgi:GH24 family phage-related lysozyme (muramidase)